MNKNFSLVGSLFGLWLVGCAPSQSSGEDMIAAFRSKVHFNPNHGSKNVPLSIQQRDTAYHLFYLTGSEEWGHATSPDLIHWTYQQALDVPSKEIGDIQLVKSAPNEPTRWIRFYADGEVSASQSENLLDWQDIDLNIDGVKGVPKVNQQGPNEWILSITNAQNIHFFMSTDLKKWSQRFSIPNTYEAKYAELAHIEGVPYLIINGYSSYVRMRYSKEGKLLEDSTPFRLANQDMGTFFKIDTADYVVYTIKDKLFTTPLHVSRADNGYLQITPSLFLRKQAISKRRGRLSRLVGHRMVSWYQFSLDSLTQNGSIWRARKDGKYVEISFKRADNDLWITYEGVKEKIEYKNDLKVDLILDGAYMALFFEGGFHFSSFMEGMEGGDKISLALDGKTVDPRTLLYTINDTQYQ